LEGGVDLPRSRTAIIGLGESDGSWQRLLLHPQDYGFSRQDPPLVTESAYLKSLTALLEGDRGPLYDSAVWNGGFYLWRLGVCDSLHQGFSKARSLIGEGHLGAHLDRLRQVVTALV
ncbi:MAG: hypothetical protein ACKO63_01595, partial [Nodosilinea sp.]